MAGDGGRDLPEDFRQTANGGVVAWDEAGGDGAAAVGIFVPAGSRDEAAEEWGAAHLLEHLAFRGAGSWDARALADRMDRLGADINAFTTRDLTCYHAHVLDRDLAEAWDLLSAMVGEPWLHAAELDRERGVVSDELREAHDDAEDRAEEAYFQALWGSHPLAHEVLGSPDQLAGVSIETLRQFHARHYRAPGLAVVLVGHGAGALAHRVQSWIEAMPGGRPGHREPPRPVGGVALATVPGQEAYVSLGVPAPPLEHEAETAYRLLALIFGGQNSSRLWQRIREELGLAYQVGAAYTPARDYGEFGVSAGVAAGELRRLLQEVGQEWRRLVRDPVSREELERARDQASRALVFGRETAEGRMHYLAHWATRQLPPPAPAVVLNAITEVSLAAVHAAAQQVVTSAEDVWACGVAGPKASLRGSFRRWFAGAAVPRAAADA